MSSFSKSSGPVVLALAVLLAAAPAAWSSNCGGTSVGFTPLNDLGTGK